MRAAPAYPPEDEADAAVKDRLLGTESVDHALSERALAARLGPVRSALERLRAEEHTFRHHRSTSTSTPLSRRSTTTARW